MPSAPSIPLICHCLQKNESGKRLIPSDYTNLHLTEVVVLSAPTATLSITETDTWCTLFSPQWSPRTSKFMSLTYLIAWSLSILVSSSVNLTFLHQLSHPLQDRWCIRAAPWLNLSTQNTSFSIYSCWPFSLLTQLCLLDLASVIYCCITIYLETLPQGLSRGCNQGVKELWSHLKVPVWEGGPAPKLIHVVVGRFQFWSVGLGRWFLAGSVPYCVGLSIGQLTALVDGFHQSKQMREQEQARAFWEPNLRSNIPSLLPYSIH